MKSESEQWRKKDDRLKALGVVSKKRAGHAQKHAEKVDKGKQIRADAQRTGGAGTSGT